MVVSQTFILIPRPKSIIVSGRCARAIVLMKNELCSKQQSS